MYSRRRDRNRLHDISVLRIGKRRFTAVHMSVGWGGLILAGSDGRHAADRVLLGSTMEQIVRHAGMAVLVRATAPAR